VYAWVLCACRRNTLKARTISAFGNFHGICIYRAINIVLLMGVCWLVTLCVYLSQPTRRTSCFCPPHVLKWMDGWMDVCVSECTWMDEDKWDMQMPFDLIERQAINPKRISRRAHKIASLSTKCNHNATIFQNTCPFVQHAMHR